MTALEMDIAQFNGSYRGLRGRFMTGHSGADRSVLESCTTWASTIQIPTSLAPSAHTFSQTISRESTLSLVKLGDLVSSNYISRMAGVTQHEALIALSDKRLFSKSLLCTGDGRPLFYRRSMLGLLIDVWKYLLHLNYLKT